MNTLISLSGHPPIFYQNPRMFFAPISGNLPFLNETGKATFIGGGSSQSQGVSTIIWSQPEPTFSDSQVEQIKEIIRAVMKERPSGELYI